MKTDLNEIRESLSAMLKRQTPPLRIRNESEQGMEVCGTKERMQGKQKVDGYYFASIVPKPKDIRFYFFPIYTHPDQFEDISPEFRKALKGKSCFHIKKLSAELEAEIDRAIQKGVEVYLAEDLI